MTRTEAMRNIQMYDLALEDTILFLDTHPKNKAALIFYNEMHDKLMEAMSDFENQFGPLTAEDVNTDKGWIWVTTPWPWEMEG